MDRQAGGTSVAVAGLTDALQEAGCPVTLLFGQSDPPAETVAPRQARAVAVRVVRLGRYTLATPGLAAAAQHSLGAADRCVIHSHGMWTTTGRAMRRLARQYSLPFVLSPHGMLEPVALAQRRWRKSLALVLGERTTLAAANLLVATSAREAQGMRALGLKAPIAVVPIGVHVPARRAAHVAGEVRQALFVGRVHPIKGLPLLIEAWSRVRPSGWRCVIAGPSEGRHRLALEQLLAARGLTAQFEFAGALDPASKERLYCSSDLFVLPSLSENFGIVVAEALSYGVPVLATRGAPWERLETCGAGWWVDASANGLEQGLRAAFATTREQRVAMGEAGRGMAAAELHWSGVGRQLLQCYEWLFEPSGPPPDSIVLD